jgi:hypothetical protein
MARIQQSIEVAVPVHAVYQQLTQFEDYPRFMQDIETVRQLDDTHLHWWMRVDSRRVEWDAEITEQQPDRSIAWHNTSGPVNVGKVELRPVGTDKAHVTMIIESEVTPVAGAPTGSSDAVMAQRLGQDLMRFKEFMETRGAESGQAGHSVEDAFDPPRAADTTYAAYAAGSEVGGDEQAETGRQTAGQAAKPMQSNAALSRSSDDQAEDGRFSVAEEQNFDQQSDEARRVGQMPQDAGGAEPVDAMAKAMTPDEKKSARLKQSIERSVPPSE